MHLDRFSRFAGLTTVTDRQTDRPTDHVTRSVTIGRIYVCGTAMQPNNWEYCHTCACVQLSEAASADGSHSEAAGRQQQSKVEDILVKMIRLVANLSISVDIGEQLACTDSLLELLMDVISMCRLRRYLLRTCCLIT